MIDDYNFPISVETFAAYLDNNLLDADMQQVAAIIETNDDMQQLMSQSMIIDEEMDTNGYLDEQLPESLANDDFDIPNINRFTEETGDYDSGNLYTSESHFADRKEDVVNEQIPLERVEEIGTGPTAQMMSAMGHEPTGGTVLSSDEHYIPEDEIDTGQTAGGGDDFTGVDLLGVDS